MSPYSAKLGPHATQNRNFGQRGHELGRHGTSQRDIVPAACRQPAWSCWEHRHSARIEWVN